MITIVVVLWLGLAAAVGAAARSRGRSFGNWFVVAVLISPLLALIFLIAFQPRQAGPTKVCKFCRSQVAADAMVCPHCQRDIMTMEEAQAMDKAERSAAFKSRQNLLGIALAIAAVVWLALAFNGKQLP